MSDVPLVSYLVPSYNHRAYVQQTVDSVLAQDYPRIELIVGDDCSPDGSGEFLARYAAEKGFTLVQNETNLGSHRNLNRLIELARGEYVGFLGSDDWIDPLKTKEQVAYLLETQFDGVLAPVRKYEQATGVSQVLDLSHLQQTFDEHRYLQHLYTTDCDTAVGQSGLFRRRNVVDLGGFLPEYKSDDWLFQMRFLQAGFRIGMLNKPFTNYRQHPSNTHRRAVYCLEEIQLPIINDFVPPEYRSRTLASVYATAAHKLTEENKMLSLRYALKSFAYHPRPHYVVHYAKQLILSFPQLRAASMRWRNRSRYGNSRVGNAHHPR